MDLDIRPLPRDLPLAESESWRDPEGGAQLRCCLRHSRAGESLVLASVVPPGPQGPYAEAGPVFVHAEPCAGPADTGYPDEFRGRTMVFRAYSADGRIVGGRLVEAGEDPEGAARELLTDDGVAFVHVRNVVFGCYLLAIHPA